MTKKQSRLTSLLLTFMISLLVIMSIGAYSSTIKTFADDKYSDAASAIAGETKSLSAFISTSQDASHPDGPITGNDGKAYYYDNTKSADIIAAANRAANKAAGAAANDAAVEDFQSYTDGLGLSADYQTASEMMSGFTGVVRTLLGILVVIVSVGMTIFSGFDLCYIAFPVFRNKCEDAKQNGGILAKQNKSGGGESKLRFVSDDAQYAVLAADTVQSGKNPFVIYFGKRLISYIVLAILLFILLTGRITIFTDIAIKLVNGILNIISGI